MKAFVLALAFASALATGGDPMVSGTWEIKSEVMGYPGAEVCTLTQDGKAIAGKCTSEDKSHEVTGEIAGENVTFKHAGDYQGQPLTITYTARFESDAVLSGAVNVLPYDVNGTFKATKKAE
jgi:hypothetical protein